LDLNKALKEKQSAVSNWEKIDILFDTLTNKICFTITLLILVIGVFVTAITMALLSKSFV
jgi:hypothetical protein